METGEGLTSVANAGLSYLSKKEMRKKAAYTYKHHWCEGRQTQGEARWRLGAQSPKTVSRRQRAEVFKGRVEGAREEKRWWPKKRGVR